MAAWGENPRGATPVAPRGSPAMPVLPMQSASAVCPCCRRIRTQRACLRTVCTAQPPHCTAHCLGTGLLSYVSVQAKLPREWSCQPLRQQWHRCWGGMSQTGTHRRHPRQTSSSQTASPSSHGQRLVSYFPCCPLEPAGVRDIVTPRRSPSCSSVSPASVGTPCTSLQTCTHSLDRPASIDRHLATLLNSAVAFTRWCSSRSVLADTVW